MDLAAKVWSYLLVVGVSFHELKMSFTQNKKVTFKKIHLELRCL